MDIFKMTYGNIHMDIKIYNKEKTHTVLNKNANNAFIKSDLRKTTDWMKGHSQTFAKYTKDFLYGILQITKSWKKIGNSLKLTSHIEKTSQI